MESPRTSSATEGMRTLGLRSAERGSLPVEQDDESLWRDFDSGDDLVLIGGAEVASVSSDEEPLSSVVRRSSTGRARHHQPASTPTRSLYLDTDSPLPTPPGPRRRTDQPAASSTTHAPRASPPAAPDYSSHSVAALQREVAKYGFRPSKERAVLERQLGDVWRALHCNGAPSAEAGEEEEVVEPEEKKKKTRGRKKKGVPPGEDGEEQQEEEDTETVGEKLRRLVLADEALYLRVLRYEVRHSCEAHCVSVQVADAPLPSSLQPIHFDEFVALAAQGGVKVAKPLLVRFLDEQVRPSLSDLFSLSPPCSVPDARAPAEHHVLHAGPDGRDEEAVPLRSSPSPPLLPPSLPPFIAPGSSRRLCCSSLVPSVLSLARPVACGFCTQCLQSIRVSSSFRSRVFES